MQHCTDCGTPLPPGTNLCPKCGKYIPSYYTPPPDIMNAGAETMPKAFGQPRAATPPSNIPQQPQHPSNMGISAGGTPPPYGPPVYPQAQQPHSYANFPQYPPLLQPGPGPNTRGLSRGMILLLISAAVLIMLSGVGLIFYTAVARPAQLRAQATATVQTILTTNAQNTAIANTQATGTAQANAHATATAQAQAQATATALQSIYNRATSTIPVLNSSLNAQTASNWDIYNTTDGGGCSFTGGALHSSIFQKNFYVPCMALDTNFRNFAFEVQMTILKGDAGGLIFRGNGTSVQFYMFHVRRDGSYSLFVTKDDQHSTALIDDKSTAIKTGAGQTNILTVIAQGDNIYLFINKQFVASASDGTYSSGEIGLFASDSQNSTDVAFNNAHVWTL